MGRDFKVAARGRPAALIECVFELHEKRTPKTKEKTRRFGLRIVGEGIIEKILDVITSGVTKLTYPLRLIPKK